MKRMYRTEQLAQLKRRLGKLLLEIKHKRGCTFKEMGRQTGYDQIQMQQLIYRAKMGDKSLDSIISIYLKLGYDIEIVYKDKTLTGDTNGERNTTDSGETPETHPTSGEDIEFDLPELPR